MAMSPRVEKRMSLFRSENLQPLHPTDRDVPAESHFQQQKGVNSSFAVRKLHCYTSDTRVHVCALQSLHAFCKSRAQETEAMEYHQSKLRS